MHTAEELCRTDFEYRADGQLVSRSEVVPIITPDDRIGVVMGAGTDGIGAGNFVLFCVTAFYDHLREAKDGFFEYPDYYTFQATTDPADYRMLDIYPDHKNVTVEPEAEQLLRSINDRAITILLVPEVPIKTPEIKEITRRSAERRIDYCFLYASDGRPTEAGFSIQLPRQRVEDWYQTTAHSVETVPETYTIPSFGSSDSHMRQSFRQIPVDQALSRLSLD